MEVIPCNRNAVLEILKRLYKQGYCYIVRDKDSHYITCFTLEPKKYREIEAWGYKDPSEQRVLPAYPIRNDDMTEIKWQNHSATAIDTLIKK